MYYIEDPLTSEFITMYQCTTNSYYVRGKILLMNHELFYFFMKLLFFNHPIKRMSLTNFTGLPVTRDMALPVNCITMII